MKSHQIKKILNTKTENKDGKFREKYFTPTVFSLSISRKSRNILINEKENLFVPALLIPDNWQSKKQLSHPLMF